MSYRYQGDYLYARGRGGIPFIGAALAKIAPKAIQGVGKLLGIGKKAATSNLPVPYVAAPTISTVTKTAIAAGAAGVATGAALTTLADGTVVMRKKRRSMNPLNPRALTRATRRISSFHDRSAKALRQLGYVVSRAGAARRAGGKCGCKGKCTC